jgi:hypothetical protein
MTYKSAREKIRGLKGLTVCLLLLASSGLPALSGEVEDSIKAIQKEALSKQLDGDIDGALDSYEAACSLAKNEFGENSKVVGELYLDMGILALDSAKQFDRAENYLNRATRLNDNSVTAHLKLAELLSLRGTSEKSLQARREIEKALIKNPRSQAARQALAMFYQQQGQPMRAFHQYSYLNQVMNGKTIPRDKFSHSRTVIVPEPKVEAAPAPPVYKMPSAPVGYVKPIAVPYKPVFKPKPKPVIVPKPKPKPKPVVSPVMTELPPRTEPKPQRTRPVKSRNGLVPPPPPVVPGFGGGFAPPLPAPGTSSPAFNLKTDAQIKKKSKPAEPAEEKPAAPAEKPRATPSESPDFLLDWASERKKKQ